jgi:hypothetical protein
MPKRILSWSKSIFPQAKRQPKKLKRAERKSYKANIRFKAIRRLLS